MWKLLSFFLLFWSISVQANYLKNEAVQPFINKMVTKYGFNRQKLETLFAHAEKKEHILSAIARPAEKRLEWKGYRKIFLTSQRIKQGKSFLKTYQKALDRAQKTYGVSKYIVAAILGVETRYGRHMGNYRVVDSLSTLAFDYPPRSAFFQKELTQFLLLVREQRFNSLDIKGSYAGAMGFGQFMPSSYRRYAVDFDGDNVADIIHNPVDAIGSVANYFKQHKWKKGGEVAVLARYKNAHLLKNASSPGLKPSFTLKQLRKWQIYPVKPLLKSEKAKLLKLEGAKGKEYWLVFHNFYVITRYNHSPLYAMAVYQLAEALQTP